MLKILEEIDYTAIGSLTEDGLGECCRLFHGRGHKIPELKHINIDWFPPVILISIYTEVSENALNTLAETLMLKVPCCQSVQVQHRYINHSPIILLSGIDIRTLVVLEQGLKYNIELGRSQNVGLFLDMLTGRQWVLENANNKKVLNLFAFTCAFSVAAIAGGAMHVLNVDNNNGVLSRGKENHKLNNFDNRSAHFSKLDIFKSFSRLKKYGPYDLLICDPPTYQHGSVDIRRDYAKIVRRIPQLINENGLVMLCLNSPDISASFLHEIVENECSDCEYLYSIKPPSVFEDAVEGKGLKVLIFRYNKKDKV